MKKGIINWFRNLLFFLIIGMVFLWFNSPYGKYSKSPIVTSVHIEAPCQKVYEYLGNSDHARDWSVYVAFLETLNSEEVPDGEVGSKRMCYTQEDKQGFSWEEEVLEIKKGKYRKISCYSFQNLFVNTSDLITEQVYEEETDGCKLSFTLDYAKKPSFWELVKIKYSAYKIKSVFEGNIENIKKEMTENAKK